jgi:hypothetical protein
VYFSASGKTLTLTGNLFYGNTANYYAAVCNDGGSVTASHNVVDKAPGINSDQAGWSGGTDDTTISNLPVSPRSFRLLYGSGALGKLPVDPPAGYPDTDFYDKPINGGGAAGAAQEITPEGYYYVELSANNSELGTVTTNPMPDKDGLVPAGVDITANPTDGYAAGRWVVNGARTYAAPKNISGHTWAQAIFGRRVMVTDSADTDTEGTLRYAVNHAQDDDFIQLSGPETIELTANLTITKSLILDGNGATLTKAASFESNNNSQFLRITSATAEALVRRLHFKDGLARNYGGAVYNTGNLTLESCVFSGNRVASNNRDGGAVYSVNTLTIRGCTFLLRE